MKASDLNALAIDRHLFFALSLLHPKASCEEILEKMELAKHRLKNLFTK